MPADNRVRESSKSHKVGPYRLFRFFSIASFLGIFAVTVCLIWTYRYLQERNLIEHENRANAEITRAFTNFVWNDHRQFVLESKGRSREDLLADPAQAALHKDVIEKLRGLPVTNMKIYNLQGQTIFSTDNKFVGEDQSSHIGFLNAKTGIITGSICCQDKIDAPHSTLSKKNLVVSFVPVTLAEGQPVEAVLELHSDVTSILATQRDFEWQLAAIVLGLLSALYLFLLLLARRADRIIKQQASGRAMSESRVRFLAYHDSLTGLPNRTYFTETLRESITSATKNKDSFALMFLDLDRFKIVNDTLGHAAGDMLLRVVSERLQTCVREGDLLFRMGGDEFTVILTLKTKSSDASLVAQRIIKSVSLPITINEHKVSVGATIGIGVFPSDGISAEKLLKNSDAAMYAAKEAGRGGYLFYKPEMNENISEKDSTDKAPEKRGADDSNLSSFDSAA